MNANKNTQTTSNAKINAAFTRPEQRAAWLALERQAQNPLHLAQLLQDKDRNTAMQITGAGLLLDFSHQRINAPILSSLLDLARESNVETQKQAMFAGEAINRTENRPVLHVALRGSRPSTADPLPMWGKEISAQVLEEQQKITALADRLNAGLCKGASGERITHVVNLGIGGSDLGPRMAYHALAMQTRLQRAKESKAHASKVNNIVLRFASNIDSWDFYQAVEDLHPANTAFIVQSKTFTTQETMTLLASARRWLADAGLPADKLHDHFYAVTAKPELAKEAGFLPEHTLKFWDWVGGRYSLCSAIGFPVAVGLGSKAWLDICAGAAEMDTHFLHAPPAQNLPLIQALVGIWNRNFLGAPSINTAPYSAALRLLPAYLQQLDMESNGKRVHIDGSEATIGTGPIVWGGLGIDGQHAYFQLLHQGKHLVPMEFIGVRTSGNPLPLAMEHQRINHLNMAAQARALAIGRDAAATMQALKAESGPQSGSRLEQLERLTPHRTFPGNIPSSTLWLEEITPRSLGSLLAFYEHKIFCQAAIWGIAAFDQWGVELGKTMVKEMSKD